MPTPPSKRPATSLAVTSDRGAEQVSAHGTEYQVPGLEPRNEPTFDQARRRSLVEEDEDPLRVDTRAREEKKEPPITWMSLPRKSQLAILVTARLSE
jgi:hypothetical protein